MKTLTRTRLFSYLMLLMLLAIRMPIGDIALNFIKLLSASFHPSWVTSLVATQGWTYYFWADWSFILAGIVIIVNRNDLQGLNVDQYFLAIFVWSGLAYCWSYVWPTGWIAALISCSIALLYINKKFKFGNTVPNMWRITLIIGIIFFLGLFFIRTFFDNKNLLLIIRYWLVTEISFVIVEELIFRGLLWKFLEDLGWSTPKIVALQATLFWLFHAYYMFEYPYFFWIMTPIAGVLFGIIVWRSKSIFPSTVAHVLFNLLQFLLP